MVDNSKDIHLSPYGLEVVEPTQDHVTIKPFNKQLYNRETDDLPDYVNNPDKFFNSKDPNLVIQHEKPEHRFAIYLKAQGCSNREIAQRMGWTEPWVSQLMRQPWARQRLSIELKEAGQDELRGILKSAAVDSLYRLIELRDSGPAPVAKAAADSLLDRYLGKAVQHVTHDDKPKTPATAEVHALEEQIEQLEKELGVS